LLGLLFCAWAALAMTPSKAANPAAKIGCFIIRNSIGFQAVASEGRLMKEQGPDPLVPPRKRPRLEPKAAPGFAISRYLTATT
jgi:hypothetical protein